MSIETNQNSSNDEAVSLDLDAIEARYDVAHQLWPEGQRLPWAVRRSWQDVPILHAEVRTLRAENERLTKVIAAQDDDANQAVVDRDGDSEWYSQEITALRSRLAEVEAERDAARKKWMKALDLRAAQAERAEAAEGERDRLLAVNRQRCDEVQISDTRHRLAEAQLAAVRELHRELPCWEVDANGALDKSSPLPSLCAECTSDDLIADYEDRVLDSGADVVTWPCATIAAVPGLLETHSKPDLSSSGPLYDEIKAERERAHAKHGDTSMESAPATDPTGRRLRILLEEVGEVAREFNDAEHEQRPVDLAHLRTELIQTAAMAAAWADACAAPSSLPVSVTQPTGTKSAAQLLRELAAADPEGHKAALARGYGCGPRVAPPVTQQEER